MSILDGVLFLHCLLFPPTTISMFQTSLLATKDSFTTWSTHVVKLPSGTDYRPHKRFWLTITNVMKNTFEGKQKQGYIRVYLKC